MYILTVHAVVILVVLLPVQYTNYQRPCAFSALLDKELQWNMVGVCEWTDSLLRLLQVVYALLWDLK
jgi:hypothetical protein